MQLNSISLGDSVCAREQNVAHLMIDDAASLYARLVGSNVTIIKEIRGADFGLTCFVFADPDGNRIDVGQML